jgi:hypothetical protein
MVVLSLTVDEMFKQMINVTSATTSDASGLVWETVRISEVPEAKRDMLMLIITS